MASEYVEVAEICRFCTVAFWSLFIAFYVFGPPLILARLHFGRLCCFGRLSAHRLRVPLSSALLPYLANTFGAVDVQLLKLCILCGKHRVCVRYGYAGDRMMDPFLNGWL